MSSIVDLAKNTIAKEIDSLKTAMDRLGSDFEKAVGLIAEASGKVITTGLGKSGIVAGKIAATFCGTGTPAVFMHPVDALHGDFGLVQNGDVAVLVSKSGETQELLTFCKIVRSLDCRTIGIVGRRGSSLATSCDGFLDASIDAEACPLDLAPTSSAIVAVALGDALSACLMKHRGFTPAAFSRLHPSGSLGKRLLLRVRDVMHNGCDMPVVKPGTSMKEAVVALSTKAMGAVIVATEERQLLGIFTDGDLRRCLERHENVLQLIIDDVMTRNPVVASSHQMAVEAVELMENRPSQISVLPVLDDNRSVVGIVRIHDLVNAGL